METPGITIPVVVQHNCGCMKAYAIHPADHLLKEIGTDPKEYISRFQLKNPCPDCTTNLTEKTRFRALLLSLTLPRLKIQGRIGEIERARSNRIQLMSSVCEYRNRIEKSQHAPHLEEWDRIVSRVFMNPSAQYWIAGNALMECRMTLHMYIQSLPKS